MNTLELAATIALDCLSLDALSVSVPVVSGGLLFLYIEKDGDPRIFLRIPNVNGETVRLFPSEEKADLCIGAAGHDNVKKALRELARQISNHIIKKARKLRVLAKKLHKNSHHLISISRKKACHEKDK